MPSIPSDIEISQNASMKQVPEIASMLILTLMDLNSMENIKQKLKIVSGSKLKTIQTGN
ncbi:MAG: hypothetical protein Ct9H300mP28_18270 [Pseudomonadota bacterium]|nr:MAG: hypothetical protein Ct9H300mP28_18270 [Pseudomonadota bacterium]